MIAIGLMGVDSNNVLYTPSGKRICQVPAWLAWRIQRIQHWIAVRTWK